MSLNAYYCVKCNRWKWFLTVSIYLKMEQKHNKHSELTDQKKKWAETEPNGSLTAGNLSCCGLCHCTLCTTECYSFGPKLSTLPN